ncbi:hypothetical protein JHQ11_001367 [Salmonella enterica subsp. enterica serovar Javiana]|uniref:Uncharacterized protein n=1 Tax=Salmonella enterica subsp. enterica serovar Javiana TaxID=363569 RepID=A0A733VKD8_SALET|nr:hypothetical protein [Salmonella enterica subsp. enterica serovar Javiana]EBA9400569.1 hypothetical protein [Salmonella enterica]EBK0597012.1 hypothetical protein [Salmonella enterica]EBM2257591.1 hypothetical protein [Salmonella enterica]EBR8497760.1 hypothetical protein [Salmonella enterica subsp. enterica serovar Javiana]
MSFKDKVEEKKMRRMAHPPELTVKDWISLYDLLRSAKAQDSEAMYEDFASVLLTTLSVEHHPELYRQDGNKLNAVADDHFAWDLLSAPMKGKMSPEELAKRLKTLSQLLCIYDEDISNDESLRTHGFLRDAIAPILDFELLDSIEDEPDYKEKYFELLAAQKHSTPPPLRGESYAIKREELLITALAVISQNQRDANKKVVPTVTELLNQIEKHASAFWPHSKQLPMSRENASKELGFALHLLEQPNQNIEFLREAKKAKRKSA